MASSSSLLSEDQLWCSICLDVFTDPVSTPCGHNFCMVCLKDCWDSSSRCQCPVCMEEFSRRPELRVNAFISGLAAQFKSVQVKSSRAQEKRPSKRKTVLCEFCSEEKQKAVKSCLDCGMSYCDAHLMPHKAVANLKKHKLMEPVENLEDYICQKHERPLELFCRDDQTCVCQFCIEGDHRSHSTVPIEEEIGEKKTQLGKTQAEVQQMIQDRLKKIEEIKHSVELSKKNTEEDTADSVEVFRALVRCIERIQAEVLELMEEKQKAAERQAEEFIKELEQEITELKRRDTELEQLSHTEDHLHLLQEAGENAHTPITINGAAVERVSSFKFLAVHITEELTWTEHPTRVVKKAPLPQTAEEVWHGPPHPQNILHMYCGEHSNRLHHHLVYPSLCRPPHTRDWTEVNINPPLSVESLRRALSQLYHGLDKLSEIKLNRIQQYAVDVTLDPDTAHCYLILSADWKRVTCGDERQDLPDNPERFDPLVCVLGKEGFSSGRFYYEVQVSGKTDWDLGLTTESSNRKGVIVARPENGYWMVFLRNGTIYRALDSPSVALSLKQAPQKVGVFVDYDEGLVSFFDVEARSHIYSFTVMASSSSLLSEDQLLCSICLDVFTDPVSTPCGHNFCRVCLKDYWDSSSHCRCPVCKKEFPTRPELSVNTFISGLVAQFKKSVQVKSSRAPEKHHSKLRKLGKTQAEVQQMIQDRLKKIDELKHSVELSKENIEQKKADSVEVFRALVRCIERSQAELLELMEEKQETAERQAEELIKELEQEITELKRRDTELEQLSHTEDHLHLLQVYPSLCRPPPTKDWTDLRINTPLREENLRRALSQFQEELSKEMEKIPEIMDVTLDPDTAHPELLLSDDGKQVRHRDKRQDLPNNPERFDYCVNLLGKEGFSSGRFYYEVQVSGKTKWTLGVSRESSTRKGKITLSPENGHWTVWLRNETEYKALGSPRAALLLKQVPQKVGVFVDYEEGLVSFYDVEASSHIYSFTGQSFTGKLYPYFSPCTNDGVMASSNHLLSEDQLLCSICLDVFTDPVSTPCGHNFCMVCLKDCWDSRPRSQCPVCMEEFSRRPELRVNTFISGLAAQFKKSVQVKSSRAPEKPPSKPKKVLCDSCSEEKLEAVKSCLDCGVSYCDVHLALHKTTPKFKNHKLMEPVENLEDYICQKHERPLELFCRDDQMCVCQLCTEGNHRNHNTVPIQDEIQVKKIQLEMTQTNIQLMIQDRLKTIEEIKHSVELSKKGTEQEKADSVEVFRALVRCIERSQAELLELMEEKQEATERQAEEFIKELEQEITELKRRDAELEQLSHTEDHLHLLQVYPSLCRPPHTKDWTDLHINTPFRVKSLRRALSQLQEELSKEKKKIDETEMRGVQQYAVDVTLDPDTAHPELFLSHCGKQLRHTEKRQNLPDNPERFDRCPCVLGKGGFSSGRFYYEVQVSGKTDWDLGVTTESSNRKGRIIARPENGHWIVCLRNETEYTALDSPRVPLPLKQAPQKVGVFVDYEEGLVSFYDVEATSHIYSFTVMASSSSLLSEDQLLCSICLDVFTDPVSTPCGHNFC
ncbi:hypothetical protein NFI96_002853, partial [Prochilodus magdalenae]